MNAIPYAVDPRSDTGVNNVQLGMWLFIASEVMLFGGLFSAYFMLRAGAPQPWPPLTGHFEAAVVSTVLLYGSTACFALAMQSARGRHIPQFRGWMLAATVLAFLFLAYKALQYLDLHELHLYPSTSTQWATYFLLTGVHALHVVGGLLVDAALLVTSTSKWVDAAPRVINRVEATAKYWYLVDLVWVVIFVLFYVA